MVPRRIAMVTNQSHGIIFGLASAIIKIHNGRNVQKAEGTVKLEKLGLGRYSDMLLQPEYPLRTALKRGSNHVTLSKGMDFYESQFRSRSINIAAEATEDNQDAHSQEPSEIQTTHQDSTSCFQRGNFMLARGASNTKKCLLHFIAACHEDLQNSRTAYQIQLHLTRVTTTTNKKKILCCSTKHHDIETPLLRCHHKYTESVRRTIHHEHAKIALV